MPEVLPKQFLQERRGNSSLALAAKQQAQLSYFTQSKIQQEVNEQYLQKWVERNYTGTDFFLNWIKAVFKTDNFMSFFKYFRHPIASTSLINDRIKEPLSRVFFAEDSFFNYTINGEAVQTPKELKEKKFNEKIFNALLFRHNDILLTDLSDINKPFRQLIKIENVVALESRENIINRLAIRANAIIEDKFIKGFLVVDALAYMFFDEDHKLIETIPHDLGKCPANYIAAEAFKDDDIVRKSIFSHNIEKFEEYVFLKTIQRMTEPNGAIPTVTKLKTNEKAKNDNDIGGEMGKEPMTFNEIGGQRADVQRTVQGKGSPLQAGTIVEVDAPKNVDGSINMDVVTNFLNFFFIPTEALEYLNTRINQIEQNIIVNVLGDFSEIGEAAKNELQISKSFVSKQDKLRGISKELSRIRNLADFDFLALQHGRDNVSVDCFYGSDFFIETEKELFDLHEKAPNPIEARNVLLRLARNRARFLETQDTRDYILYTLIPYARDKDFDIAQKNGQMSRIIFEYQTRFNHWINLFEAMFGDIVVFWQNFEGETGERIVVINNLILEIIRKETEAIGEQQTQGNTEQTETIAV